tara:strand:+ start:1669 stop:1839 length:171 start_codon:yes stop_codon:yes gene_type:complete
MRKIFIPASYEVETEKQAIDFYKQNYSTSERIIEIEKQDDGWIFILDNNGDDLGPG